MTPLFSNVVRLLCCAFSLGAGALALAVETADPTPEPPAMEIAPPEQAFPGPTPEGLTPEEAHRMYGPLPDSMPEHTPVDASAGEVPPIPIPPLEEDNSPPPMDEAPVAAGAAMTASMHKDLRAYAELWEKDPFSRPLQPPQNNVVKEQSEIILLGVTRKGDQAIATVLNRNTQQTQLLTQSAPDGNRVLEVNFNPDPAQVSAKVVIDGQTREVRYDMANLYAAAPQANAPNTSGNAASRGDPAQGARPPLPPSARNWPGTPPSADRTVRSDRAVTIPRRRIIPSRPNPSAPPAAQPN